MVEKASSMPLSKCQRCPECSTASILGCRELALHVSKPTDPMFHVFSHLKRESHEEGLRNPFYPYVARRLKAPGLLSFTVFEDYRVPRCSKYPSFKLASASVSGLRFKSLQGSTSCVQKLLGIQSFTIGPLSKVPGLQDNQARGLLVFHGNTSSIIILQ